MKKIFALLLVVAAPLLLAACGAAETASPEGLIETGVGREFKVILEANPSAGYHWETLGELDGSIVELVSRGYRADEPVMPGSGGSDVWVFKAVGAGETTITLGYYPPDPSAEAQQTRTFTVIVR
jgi:predicted secreted protein